MRILSAHVEHARYARDFGQVEAIVAFLVKDEARPVPYILRRLTTVTARGTAPLRERLVASARALLEAPRKLHQPLPPASHAVSHAA
ncbi:hypothetical protein [Szabonella alba]|uniref:hypothetical protein n=1 Tax=Szabonella alba TaxID=2804194 RepID=UPI001F26042E|nr:hypothetical protein [Szabonella alba]